jgi:glucose/arabinose dehydrogenase
MRALAAAVLLLSIWNPPLKVTHVESPARTHIKASALPPPNAAAGADTFNFPNIVWQPEDAVLRVPPGFAVAMFAGNLRGLRAIVEASNGDVLVAESWKGRVVLLRDANRDGRIGSDERYVLLENLQRPSGLALSRTHLYVGQTGRITRYAYRAGQTSIAAAGEKLGDLPPFGYRAHWTRYLALSPDQKKLYVAVGSQTNNDVEPDPRRGTILEIDLATNASRIYASGLRNATGLAFQPGTKQLWTTCNERDELGDDLPPDFVTAVREGGFYGWPYAYIGPHPDPVHGSKRPDLVAATLTPDVLIEAHSAALGMAFYDGTMFPKEYRGDAFVALHGSWNRARRTGYKVIRVRFRDGKATGEYEDFLTGFMLGEDNADVWGRPVNVSVLRDGSLLVGDDGGGKIWRVTWSRAPAARAQR